MRRSGRPWLVGAAVGAAGIQTGTGESAEAPAQPGVSQPRPQPHPQAKGDRSAALRLQFLILRVELEIAREMEGLVAHWMDAGCGMQDGWTCPSNPLMTASDWMSNLPPIRSF